MSQIPMIVKHLKEHATRFSAGGNLDYQSSAH
eukprot:UN19715